MDEQDILNSEECRKRVMAIYDAMDVLNGKWKVSIMSCLCFSPKRYSDLLKKVLGISGKVLSRELKDLEMNQLIKRTEGSGYPKTVIYELTEYGETLKEVIDVIANWGLQHREQIIRSSRKKVADLQE
ncbi:winged helix-turn-helix transcriptional regulator [Desertivirga brevis]|uniref:winged helix-turn-helix transcriptional regulator n=1 Tax=Desertivirga brevis TaxID=2810310 RepID=UPI001A9776A3|nr:helix-turn-helix domain-containing protein [Pedobacter sp. SYSU D00873]